MRNKITLLIIISLTALFSYLLGSKQPSTLQKNNIETKSTESRGCTRTSQYNNLPEFKRAISLILQRFDQNSREYNNSNRDPFLSKLETITNCLNIQYSDLSQDNAEGIFIFDTTSSPNDLKIFVDSTYQDYDDLLTATLLTHELVHAVEFVNYKETGFENTCLDKEANAYIYESAFLGLLNQEEKRSLAQRLANSSNTNNAYLSAKYLIKDIGKTAMQMCNLNPNQLKLNSEQSACYFAQQRNLILEMIKQNQFYKKQCNL